MITAENAKIKSNNAVEWYLRKLDKKIRHACEKGYTDVEMPLDGIFVEKGMDQERVYRLRNDLINRIKTLGYKVDIKEDDPSVADHIIVEW